MDIKYDIFVNGQLNGHVETDDINEYMKGQEYNQTSCTIDEEDGVVYIRVDIFETMSKAMRNN